MTRKAALVDFILALALLMLLGWLAGLGLALLPPGLLPPLLLLVVIQGLIVLTVVAALQALRRQSWTALGLVRMERRDVGRTAVALVLLIAVGIAVNVTLQQFAPQAFEAHMQRLAALAVLLTSGVPLAGLVAAVAFIGFYEEVLARGLLLQRCRRFVGGTWAPVLISSVLFGLGHAYQGWTGVVQTTLIGILLARLTLRWGTLWPAIIAHAALNGWSLLILGMQVESAGVG
jgi:uncharacterized protein